MCRQSGTEMTGSKNPQRRSKATQPKKARKARQRKKARARVVFDAPERKPRPNKKTIYLTDEHAFRLSALAAMSSLNGRKYEQSSIVEEALTLWFEQADLPSEFTVKLDM